jgi:signal transduction histidine kinase
MRRRIAVLLVEDDEDDELLTRGYLAEIDDVECALTWARSFAEGLRYLSEGSYDVCLLDYALGDRTGMELLTRAVAAGVEVPIIFLTGQAERALDIEATRSGAADYLVKGRINADLLERSIRYAIERGRSLSTLRLLNRELELTRDQAIEANRAKSGFLTAVSHAYRDPLGAIVACSAALQERLAGRDAVAEGLAREIGESGQRLLDLLTEVLDLSEREVPPPPLELRHVALFPFIHELVAAIRPLVGHNDNTLELCCPEDIGALETDPAQLGRVMLGLLGNVCKFTRRGRIVVALSRRPARRRDLDAAADAEPLPGVACVEFAIRPSGLWMSPAQLELLFASVPQAEAGELPRGARESGIASSRRVCHSLGGELFVETEGVRRPVLRVCLPDPRPAHTVAHADVHHSDDRG